MTSLHVLKESKLSLCQLVGMHNMQNIFAEFMRRLLWRKVLTSLGGTKSVTMKY